jgi:large-conductance mechanosensitive channel
MKKKEQEKPPAPAKPDPEVVLLEEIRDLLKTKQ